MKDLKLRKITVEDGLFLVQSAMKDTKLGGIFSSIPPAESTRLRTFPPCEKCQDLEAEHVETCFFKKKPALAPLTSFFGGGFKYVLFFLFF